MSGLEWPDIIVIVCYFVAMLIVGLWSSRYAKTDTAQGYFLAGRTTTWIPIGASTWSTNIGAHMFIGLAGSAAAGGIAVVMYEWHAMFMLVALGWFFLPTYIASGCLTMPQYLKLRYGGQRIRTFLACLTVAMTIISEISGQMYAGAIFFREVFEWSLYPSVLLILTFTATFSALGGLTTVMWTDTMQTVILVIGAALLGAISLNEVGGFNSMREQFLRSASNETYYAESVWGNRSCGTITTDAFHIFRPIDDGSYPWTGMIFGLTILATNAWCTDQTSVQRALSAKTMTHGKAGLLLAAYLKVLPFFFFIIPGMISRVLYPDEVGCSNPDLCDEICSNPSGCSNIAYPLLVVRILPTGVRGIMLAALLAALISSLTSIFNSVCTVFTMEIWKQVRPRAKENELMVVSRICILCLVAISFAWLPILQRVQGSNFWDYVQSLASFTTPPTIAVFVMGIFWTRATEKGAFAALVICQIIGFIRMGLEWSRTAPDCGSGREDNQFAIVTEIHYLHFAAILFTIGCVIIVIVSLMTEPRSKKQLRRVTIWTRHEVELQAQSDNESEPETETNVMEKSESHIARRSEWKQRLLKYVCGVKDEDSSDALSSDERNKLMIQQTNIYEDPWWRRFLNVQAIVCCGVAVVLHAFWA